jgi:hypothetical protein
MILKAKEKVFERNKISFIKKVETNVRNMLTTQSTFA